MTEPALNAAGQPPVILFGGLTWKHERMIEAVLRRAGYPCHGLPEPTREAHEIGKEFCGAGLCNPVYFTAGNLILYLRKLESEGVSRAQIVGDYAFFTAGSNGPCRFGMYESEFRAALREAGYDGFRVYLFQQDHGVKASVGNGLVFSVDFGMDALHGFILGDLLNELDHQLRPYEQHPGEVEAAMRQVTENVALALQTAPRFELANHAPRMLRDFLLGHAQSRLYRFGNTWGKVFDHLYGKSFTAALRNCRAPLESVEIDRLRPRPVVKVIGEFWAQQTESDGNFRMFHFLEEEGAEVSVEPLSNWVLYLLNQFRDRAAQSHNLLPRAVRWRRPWEALRSALKLRLSRLAFNLGERIYLGHYRRLAVSLGLHTHRLPSQRELARLADPYYNHNLRGGEGHLEVAKNLYYTLRGLCHMVLALKPFGCMPSLQSDAVQAGLVARMPEMNFLSVETSAEGAIHAYSRVQMALSEARSRARQEFERTLQRSGLSLGEARALVHQHPELRGPFYEIKRRPGVVSTAANYLLDIAEHMRAANNRGERSANELAGAHHAAES